MLKPPTVTSQNHYSLHYALYTSFSYEYFNCVKLQILHNSICHASIRVRTLYDV